jgi:hypothetical protein
MSVNRTPTILKYAQEFYCRVFLIIFKKGVLIVCLWSSTVVGVLRSPYLAWWLLAVTRWIKLCPLDGANGSVSDVKTLSGKVTHSLLLQVIHSYSYSFWVCFFHVFYWHTSVLKLLCIFSKMSLVRFVTYAEHFQNN